MCLVLGFGASRLHKKLVPAKPDLASTIIESVRKMIGHQPTAAEIANELARRQAPARPQQQAYIQLEQVQTILDKPSPRHPQPYAELIYRNPGTAVASSVKFELKSFWLDSEVPGQRGPSRALENRLFKEAISMPSFIETIPSMGIATLLYRIPVSLNCILDKKETKSPFGKFYTVWNWTYVVGRISFHDTAGYHTDETCRFLIPPAMSFPLPPAADPTSLMQGMVNRWQTCEVHDGPGPDREEK